MKKIIFTAILVVVFAAQWVAPLKMIYDNENVITQGKAYKFKTQPIDPSDPFRGKYIVLNFELNSIPAPDLGWKYDDDVFLVVDEDSLGFARVASVAKAKPTETHNFVKAKTGNYINGKLHYRLPFNRFYMNEKKAYSAEVLYREAQTDSLPNNSYALVFIKEGRAVLADVLINNKSVTTIKPPSKQK